MDVHDLTAAYALDGLDADETETYERHLGQCEQCREQLAEHNETAGALAFGTVAPAPPPQLRSAILEAAEAERSNVVPLLRRRWVARGLAVAAAAAACIAVGLGVALTPLDPPQVVAGLRRCVAFHIRGGLVKSHPSAECRPREDTDRGHAEQEGEEPDDPDAERGHDRLVRHAPDVVQPASVAEEAVAHEGERVRERQE